MVPSHGEIQGQNMIFNRNKLVSLIDWDSLSIRPRVYDIAMSAIFLSRKREDLSIYVRINFSII